MTTTTHQSEIQLQAACFQWCWNQLPATRRLLFHVPNGGSRSKIEGMQLKASGVIAGVPDMLLLWGGRIYAFELKTTIGVVSPAQKELHQIWARHGVTVHIVRSLEEFQLLLNTITTQ